LTYCLWSTSLEDNLVCDTDDDEYCPLLIILIADIYSSRIKGEA